MSNTTSIKLSVHLDSLILFVISLSLATLYVLHKRIHTLVLGEGSSLGLHLDGITL